MPSRSPATRSSAIVPPIFDWHVDAIAIFPRSLPPRAHRSSIAKLPCSESGRSNVEPCGDKFHLGRGVVRCSPGGRSAPPLLEVLSREAKQRLPIRRLRHRTIDAYEQCAWEMHTWVAGPRPDLLSEDGFGEGLEHGRVLIRDAYRRRRIALVHVLSTPGRVHAGSALQSCVKLLIKTSTRGYSNSDRIQTYS